MRSKFSFLCFAASISLKSYPTASLTLKKTQGFAASHWLSSFSLLSCSDCPVAQGRHGFVLLVLLHSCINSGNLLLELCLAALGDGLRCQPQSVLCTALYLPGLRPPDLRLVSPTLSVTSAASELHIHIALLTDSLGAWTCMQALLDPTVTFWSSRKL